MNLPFTEVRKKTHRSKHTKTTEYICYAQNCGCKKEVVQTTVTGRSAKKTVEVFEIGDHKQPGETVSHLPVKRRSFRWRTESTDFMAKYVQDHRVSSPSVVLQELKLKKLDYGATLKNVKNWLKSHKKKKHIKAPYSGDPLNKLKLTLEGITKVEDWDGKDMDTPLLFPGEIFLIDDEAKAFSDTLGQTKKGEKFALAAVVSTPALAKLLCDQHEVVEFTEAEQITDDGLVLKKINFPFYGIDGNGKIVRSGVLYPLATVTKNHHGRLVAVGISHNESKPTAKAVLESFKQGFATILIKMGYNEEDIDILLRNIHILSDDSTGLKKAVDEHLQQAEFGTESSCSAHILNDGF